MRQEDAPDLREERREAPVLAVRDPKADVRYGQFVALGSTSQERFASWKTWAARALGAPVQVEGVGAAPEAFRASAEVLEVRGVRIVELRAGATHIRFADRASDRESVRLITPWHAADAAGWWNGRSQSLAPGAPVLFGRGEAWWRAPEGVCTIGVSVARDLLPFADHDVDRLVAAPGLAESAVYQAVARPMLLGMVGKLRDLSGIAGAGLDTTWPSVFTMLLQAVRGDTTADTSEGSHRLSLARQFIETNLADPDLSVDKLAVALNLSRRAVYQLFASHQQSVAGMIRARRLERARKLLEDPARQRMTVGEVGKAVGLSVPAHFSRLFHAAYGVAPREYRIRHLGEAGLRA